MRRFRFAATDTIASFAVLYPQAETLLGSAAHGDPRQLDEAFPDCAALLGELARACRLRPTSDDGTDWSQLGMSELIAHILATHHPYLWAELGRFQLLIAQLAPGSGLEGRITLWCDDLRAHMEHEEDELFPLCLRLEQDHGETAPDPELPLHGMYRGHSDASSELRAISEGVASLTENAADGSPDALARLTFADLITDLHQHVELEDGVLLPAVLFNQELRTSRRFRKSQALRAIQQGTGHSSDVRRRL